MAGNKYMFQNFVAAVFSEITSDHMLWQKVSSAQQTDTTNASFILLYREPVQLSSLCWHDYLSQWTPSRVSFDGQY